MTQNYISQKWLPYSVHLQGYCLRNQRLWQNIIGLILSGTIPVNSVIVPRNSFMVLSLMQKVSWQLLSRCQYLTYWLFFFFWDEFRYSEFIPSLNLEDTITILEEKDREAFLSFARQMLSWQPEKRKTARELMDHPFLKLGGWPTAHLLWKNKILPKRIPALILATCQLSLNYCQL